MGFEIAEQLGWRAPEHVVAPMAGGSLIGKIHKAFREFEKLGLLDAAGPHGCSAPRRRAATRSRRRSRPAPARCRPIRKPNTIAKSLAIGDPADGYFASKLIRETGGWGEDVDDDEIVEAMTLLAETEGIFAETAGGVTLAVARKLIEQGKIDRDGSGPLHHRQRPEDAGGRRRADRQPRRHPADARGVRGARRAGEPSRVEETSALATSGV